MTPARTVVALAAAGLVLSGCGGAHPGVAVEVGDREISTRRVDTAARHLCTALRELEDLESGDQVYSMAFVRQRVVGLLTLRAQTEQIAEEYDVEPGAAYRDAVAQTETAAAPLADDVRADYVEVWTAGELAGDVLEQVGRIELEEKGVEDPTPEQVGQAGIDVFTVWPDVHGVEVDPRYGLENADGLLSPVDTSVAVAVSEPARDGLAAALASPQEQDVAYARSLPPEQRCG